MRIPIAGWSDMTPEVGTIAAPSCAKRPTCPTSIALLSTGRSAMASPRIGSFRTDVPRAFVRIAAFRAFRVRPIAIPPSMSAR